MLPSGVGPEGLVAIPSRNLLVTANETDLVEDGLARSHVMIYERAEGAGRLSDDHLRRRRRHADRLGRAVRPRRRPGRAGKLYAVSDMRLRDAAGDLHDRRHADAGADHRQDRRHPRRRSRPRSSTSRASSPTARAASGSPPKATPTKLVPHALLHVDAKGEIKQEIGFPAELLAGEIRFGLEGITTVGDGDDLMLVMAVQREWKDDPKGQVKLLAYKPKAKEWSAVRYPLEQAERRLDRPVRDHRP